MQQEEKMLRRVRGGVEKPIFAFGGSHVFQRQVERTMDPWDSKTRRGQRWDDWSSDFDRIVVCRSGSVQDVGEIEQVFVMNDEYLRVEVWCI
jgi:hypothetical protein